MFSNHMFNYNNSLPKIRGKVRFFHASPSAPNVDIYADDYLIAKNISFKNSSKYIEIPADDYDFKIFIAGETNKPILKKEIDITPNGVFTISAINLPGNLDLRIITDASTYSDNSNISFLRFIHYSPTAPLLDLSLLNNKKLFKFVEYKEGTGYFPLSPESYNFKISSSENDKLNLMIPNIRLEQNKFYTLYSLGLPGEKPEFQTHLLEDGF